MGMTAATPKIDEPTNTKTVMRIAKNAALFRSMTKAALAALIDRSHHVFYEAGDVIVCQGDDDSSVYLVLAGRVRVLHSQEDRKTVEGIADLGPGEVFGELAVLETQPRSATVLTLEPTSCLKVSGTEFLAALKESQAS